ncbi:MAG: hypothetical protein COB15_16480 [Flavobacteriales bacterium]|nr:MAG: hypothetical protein COB15_16480 [Flavobacteriales bacterium]
MIIDYNHHLTEVGKSKLINNIKILLYKENENIFEKIDFKNDRIYQEPLLFAYFNSNNSDRTTLDTILFGYIKPKFRPKQLQVNSDEFGRVYLPNLGWFHTAERKQVFVLTSNLNNDFSLLLNDDEVSFKFEELEIIEGTSIELLKYPIPLLNQFYYDSQLNHIEVEIETISKKNIVHLTNAWAFIKRLIPEQYSLIENIIIKNVVFNVDPLSRNSFTTLSANGISFYNAYQDNYNEVFFVDDIAHQTGHVIFYSMIYEVSEFLKIDQTTPIETIDLGSQREEARDIYVVFHALYTYYTSFVCLDACLSANVFEDKKKHEALGRMGFYIMKCYHDLNLVENQERFPNGSKDLFTEKGLIIFSEIKSIFKNSVEKWKEEIQDFDMSNQPYNFTYSKFIELNPLKDKVC